MHCSIYDIIVTCLMKRIKNHACIIIYRHIIIVTPATPVVLYIKGGGVAHVSVRAGKRATKDSGQVEKVSFFLHPLSALSSEYV